MKTMGLLFLTMSWAALLPGTGYAIPAQEMSHADSEKSASGHAAEAKAVPPGHVRTSETNHRPARASLTNANRPQQLPNSRQRSPLGNAMNLHPPGSHIFAGAAKGGTIPNTTVNSAVPGRTSSLVRPAAPSLNNVPHRSPNPAVVGGSANLRSSNTGAINGTHMNRKP